MSDTGTLVVTGANGFLGRACVPRLAAAGYRVRGLVRALDASTAASAQFMPVGDLTQLDDAGLRNALRGATTVVHLAALAHRPLDATPQSTAALRRLNVDVSARLAEAAAASGVTHFVFASSVKVNGETSPPGRPLVESDPPNPEDEYAASKWAAECALAAVAEQSGLRVTALRLPLVYGPGAKANFAALVRAVRRGVPLPLAGIANRRSLLGTGNFCAALLALVECDEANDRGRATPYFVADAEPVATPDFVRAIARALRVTPRLFALPPSVLRLGGAWLGRSEQVERLLDTLEVDTSAFRARFGWSPPRSLEEGLAEAVGGSAPL
jgi:nucleoside-diphosphate-sugar epimerase